ncbi:hypothetical protein B0H14DRAFT_2578281 [Mycena olivaceomarginata]|nr:hypothetical protein B0H14DRAFT_2578281 [Mycena olivaceomarginata]
MPHRGLSFNLTVLAHENVIAAALPAVYYCTLVVGNNNSLFQPGYTLGWLRAQSQSPTCGDAARCASPYSAASWTTASLWGCTSSIRHARCFAARAKEAAEAMSTGRRKVWEELPGFCDLPPWGGRGMKNDEL